MRLMTMILSDRNVGVAGYFRIVFQIIETDRVVFVDLRVADS